jgi:hypothetical protein
MAIHADQVIDATRAIFADVDDPHRVVATEQRDGLWTVHAVDGDGRPWPGVLVVVGPDLKVWTFSSNPGVHDPDTVFAALVGIYEADVAPFVDPDVLAERLAAATAEIRALRRTIIANAKAGELRTQPQHPLP